MYVCVGVCTHMYMNMYMYVCVYMQSVSHNCFYYTSKPECAIPDDNVYMHMNIAQVVQVWAQHLTPNATGIHMHTYTYTYIHIHRRRA